MEARLIHQADGQRTFAIIFGTGDEVMSGLKDFAERERLGAARLTAIGAFSDAVLGYFDWETRQYRRNPVDDQVEVAAFLGDIVRGEKNECSVHVHVVLGRRDASALAGHLMAGHVRPTLEVVLTESPTHLHKRHDPESGLALIDPRM
jgi:hypothetical protein